MDLLIQNGMLVDESRTRTADILVEGQTITAVAERLEVDESRKDLRIIDAEGLLVFPGFIDAHTHYHLVSRGTVTADSFPQGSRLAAFGGVTTVIDFADHDKSRALIASTQERRSAMEKEMVVDFALHQGVYGIHDGLYQELDELKEAGIRAIKIFTTYKNEGYLIDTQGLKKLFETCRDLQMMVTVHAEDNDLIEELLEQNAGRSFLPVDHARLRPAEAEARAIRYIGSLAKEVGMPLYIVHLSSAQGYKEMMELKARGAVILAETTPHYLFLDRSNLEGAAGALYVMTPPLRDLKDNEVLFKAVSTGSIPIIATDHCAFTKEQKLSSHDCRTIYPGIPGTEEMAVLIHTKGVCSGSFSIEQMAAMLSANPAKAFGLYPRKGALHVGSDADIVLFDPKPSWVMSSESQHTAAGYTPYEGTEVKGRVSMTIRRGEILVEGDSYYGVEGTGTFVASSVPSIYQRHHHDQ